MQFLLRENCQVSEIFQGYPAKWMTGYLDCLWARFHPRVHKYTNSNPTNQPTNQPCIHSCMAVLSWWMLRGSYWMLVSLTVQVRMTSYDCSRNWNRSKIVFLSLARLGFPWIGRCALNNGRTSNLLACCQHNTNIAKSEDRKLLWLPYSSSSWLASN